MKHYLKATFLLDYDNPIIQDLITKKNWRNFDIQEQILSIYNFVRDDIQFGFNLDEIPASKILQEGIGQCNTKSILFMALLRALNIPCRLHGFTIDKALQQGIMNNEIYDFMPAEISHTWTEVWFNQKWYNMEGLILDIPYLSGLQRKFSDKKGHFSGYAVATCNLQDPPVYWNGDNDTYIQKKGIKQDFGVFDDPDTFFIKYGQKLTLEQKTYFEEVLRFEINQLIAEIRKEP